MALAWEGGEESTQQAAEVSLISCVVRFIERAVGTLMTPRTQVVAVKVRTRCPKCCRW